MSAPDLSNRRLAIAIGTAAASATLAIGVTASSLLGWFSPAGHTPGPDPAAETLAPAATPANAPVILVPVAPTPAPPPATSAGGDVQLVMDDSAAARGYAQYEHDDHERREHGRDHDDHEEDDDD